MFDRRQVLGAVGTAATVALAGCGDGGSGGGSGDAAAPGETRELNGLRITVTDVSEVTALDVTDPNDEDANEPATTMATTSLTAGTDQVGQQRRFIVVDLTVENPRGEPQELPAPAPAPPAAAGRISITGTGGGVDPLTPNADLVRGDTTVDSFDELIAELDWTLPAGESVSGWVLFRVGDNFDRATNTFAVQINNTAVRWRLSS